MKFATDSKCQVTNGYDDLTRLTSKTYASLNDGVSDVKAEYGYLDWISADYPDRTTGLVNSINYTYTSGDIAVSDRFYVYDRNGNITEERKGTTSSGSLREKYTYDALNRLTRHDSALQNKSYTYSYDNAGNLLKKRTYAYTTGTLGEVQDTVTYQYSSSGWKDRLISYDGTSITYDAIGNMKTFGDKSFTWQGRNLKTFAEGSDQASYVYNADGIRTKKTVNGITTEYFLNGDQIIAQTTDGDTIWFFYDSEGNRVGLIKNGACYYYLYNIQGDVIGLVRATTGKLAATYKYDAWGNCKVINAEGHTIGDVNPFRYRGYYYDAETGFYYVSSRYYDPEVGRFISADGAISGVGGDIRGYNLYSYCFNNPVNMSDPDGNWPKWVSKIGNAVKNTVKTVVKAVKKAANTVKTTVAKFAKKTSGASNKRPPTGEPGSTYVAPNGDRRTYGPDGKPVHDYDHSDHGNPKNHPHDENGGHHHDWDWTKNPPRQGAYVPNVEMIVGVGLVTVSSIGIAAVALDDLTGIGIADNFLYGPLGAGVSQGLIMIY